METAQLTKIIKAFLYSLKTKTQILSPLNFNEVLW